MSRTCRAWEIGYFDPKEKCDWQLAEDISAGYKLSSFITGAHRNDRFTRLLIYRTQYTLQIGLRYTKRIKGKRRITDKNKFVFYCVTYFLYIVTIRRVLGYSPVPTRVPDVTWRQGSIYATRRLAACEAPDDEVTSYCFGVLLSLWEDAGLKMKELATAVYNKMTSEKFIDGFEKAARPPVDRFYVEMGLCPDDIELLLGVEDETK